MHIHKGQVLILLNGVFAFLTISDLESLLKVLTLSANLFLISYQISKLPPVKNFIKKKFF